MSQSAASGPVTETSLLLTRLQKELLRLGVSPWLQPSGQSLGIWMGLYAGVSADGTRYGWNCSHVASEIATCPVDDVVGAARAIALRHDELRGIRRYRG